MNIPFENINSTTFRGNQINFYMLVPLGALGAHLDYPYIILYYNRAISSDNHKDNV